MTDVAVYFDNSGLGGVVTNTEVWGDLVSWQEGLPPDEYPALTHLAGNGWVEEPGVLAAEIEGALSSDDGPPSGALENALHELLDIVGSRVETDSVLAVALATVPDGDEDEEDDDEGAGGGGEELAGNELSHSDLRDQLSKRLAEKFGGGRAGGLMSTDMASDVWPVDVFDGYLVYRNGPKLYSIDYEVSDDDQVGLSGEPTEVMRVSEYVPVEDASAGVAANASKRLPSGRLGISPAKACQILKDGEVRGRPLTKAQRGLFGVICGRAGRRAAPATNEGVDLTEAVREMTLGVGAPAGVARAAVREALAAGGAAEDIIDRLRGAARGAG